MTNFPIEYRVDPVKCRGLAISHGGAVQISPGSLDIGVLHDGVSGAPHVLLAGPDQPLSIVGG